MESFDRHDYQALVSFTVGMSEVQESEELLGLLCRVVEELPENVTFLLEGQYLVTLLHFFLKVPFLQVQGQAIKLFVSCHLHELISDRFFGVADRGNVSRLDVSDGLCRDVSHGQGLF
jgi:hypothetical protein